MKGICACLTLIAALLTSSNTALAEGDPRDKAFAALYTYHMMLPPGISETTTAYEQFCLGSVRDKSKQEACLQVARRLGDRDKKIAAKFMDLRAAIDKGDEQQIGQNYRMIYSEIIFATADTKELFDFIPQSDTQITIDPNILKKE